MDLSFTDEHIEDPQHGYLEKYLEDLHGDIKNKMETIWFDMKLKIFRSLKNCSGKVQCLSYPLCIPPATCVCGYIYSVKRASLGVQECSYLFGFIEPETACVPRR